MSFVNDDYPLIERALVLSTDRARYLLEAIASMHIEGYSPLSLAGSALSDIDREEVVETLIDLAELTASETRAARLATPGAFPDPMVPDEP